MYWRSHPTILKRPFDCTKAPSPRYRISEPSLWFKRALAWNTTKARRFSTIKWTIGFRRTLRLVTTVHQITNNGFHSSLHRYGILSHRSWETQKPLWQHYRTPIKKRVSCWGKLFLVVVFVWQKLFVRITCEWRKNRRVYRFRWGRLRWWREERGFLRLSPQLLAWLHWLLYHP